MTWCALRSAEQASWDRWRRDEWSYRAGVATETDRDVRGAPDVTASSGAQGRSGRRRMWFVIGAVLAVGMAAFVLVWFEPQALFIDERVDQEVPTAEPTTSTVPDDAGATAEPPVTTSTPPAPAEPVDLATGTFASLDHATRGTVRVLELADGRRFVRLEGFETDNGPDLFVYLSTNPAGGPEGAFDDDYTDLGRLQGNIGDQNYEIPPDVDHTRYASVVVWCDRFDSAFGAADLAGTETGEL